jgi:hypothetical protein
MPIIGPGPDDPEHDDWDPSWETQDTPFRRWLYEKLTGAGWAYPADTAGIYAPANRYNGLDDIEISLIAILTGVSLDAVQAAHHPDLVVLDADLDRIRHRSRRS